MLENPFFEIKPAEDVAGEAAIGEVSGQHFKENTPTASGTNTIYNRSAAALRSREVFITIEYI